MHPVPPVLDITRPVVRIFVAQLRAAVTSSGRAPGAGPAGLRWLDFFDALLTGPGPEASLRPDLALDGTHLGPAYVGELQNALSQLG